MLDLIKKSIYLGLGAATATKEKVESLVDELIEKGQLAKDEKPNAIIDILDRLEKSENDFKLKIKNEVKESIGSLNIATQKDIDEIKKMIANLESKIAKE